MLGRLWGLLLRGGRCLRGRLVVLRRMSVALAELVGKAGVLVLRRGVGGHVVAALLLVAVGIGLLALLLLAIRALAVVTRACNGQAEQPVST